MIDFATTEEEELIRQSARSYAERVLAPAVRRHEAEGVPAERVQELGALGLLSAESAVAHSLALEELARIDVAATLALDPVGPARFPVLLLGGDAERSAILGARSAALVVADRPGLVPWCVPARPERVVLLAPGAVHVFDGADVEVDRPRSLALDAAGACALRLDGARAVLVLPGDTAPALARVRLYQSALLCGLLRAAWDYTSAYVRDRVAFGRPLAHHQAVAFMVVEMAMAADAAHLATARAAWEIDRAGPEAPWATDAALGEAAQSALAMTDRAVQLLGGHGYLKDHPVEKWMREARALTLLWGCPDVEV